MNKITEEIILKKKRIILINDQISYYLNVNLDKNKLKELIEEKFKLRKEVETLFKAVRYLKQDSHNPS